MLRQKLTMRVRKIEETESKLRRKELLFSRMAEKNNFEINQLKKAIKSKAPTKSDKKRFQQLEAENRTLRNLIQTEENEIEEWKHKYIELQNDHSVSINNYIEEEFSCTANREKLYALQHLTNIHFNVKKLPDEVQGMVVCQREDEKSWIPFQLPPNEIDKQQIPEILWFLTHNTDKYNQDWENVICGGEESITEE